MKPSCIFLSLLLISFILLVSNPCAAAADASLLINETKNERTSNLRAVSEQIGYRIVGGDDAAKERYPYYVSLVDGAMNHRCGGSLIASDVVLSAAHCAGGGLRWAIIGRYKRSLDGEDYDMIGIARQYVNPDFDSQERMFDQLLLKLSRPSIMPTVTLNFDADVPEVAGEDLTVIGLGRTDYQGPPADVLQQVTVDYVDNQQCRKAKDGNLSYEHDITPDMICIYGRDQGQCNGDSGKWTWQSDFQSQRYVDISFC
jgi:trypsin